VGSKALLRPIILAIALAFAGNAGAQERPTNYEAARAMIDRAQLNDVFEPIAHDDVISVRHIASGMVCLFSSGNTRAELTTFSGQPRGDDVGCIRDTEDQWTTLYATRYAPPKSAEEALAEAVAGLRHRFSDAQSTPAVIEMTSEALPPLHVAHFLTTIEDERWITSALVAQTGDWIFKLRYTARATDDEAIRRHQLEASAMLTHVLLRAREETR
jgi:hypothetical protein